MADQLQIRRGTTAENLVFTGAQGEVIVDTDKHAIVVHDGITAGGYPQASEQAVNNSTIFFDDDTGGGSTADSYQLTAKDDTLVPNQYNDGQYFGFVTTNTNTGPSTADYVGLGQKNIKYADGSDPAAGDIDGRVTMIYDAANDWLELQRKFKASEVQSRAGVRQTVLTGPVDSDGRADFITAGTGLQAIASGLSVTPILLAIGDGFSVELGASDVIISVDNNQVFGGLSDNDTNYLYLDYDEIAETITPGSTTLAPIYSQKKPTSPATGQYWYRTEHDERGEYWDGSAWQPVLRMFIGQTTTSSGSVASVVSYAYQGKYISDYEAGFSGSGQALKNHNIISVPNASQGLPLIDFEVYVRQGSGQSWIKVSDSNFSATGPSRRYNSGISPPLSIFLNSEGAAYNYIDSTGTAQNDNWTNNQIFFKASRSF